MQRISLVKEAQKLIAASLAEGGIAIDATVGNGFDTVFLARQVGECGRVYGFDIQPDALRATRDKLRASSLAERVTLFHADHASIAAIIDRQLHGSIDAVMFNLGYLPGSDKQLITRPETTLTALQATTALLGRGGIITIIAYPGHPGGKEERKAVANWCRQLDRSKYRVDTLFPAATNDRAPQLYAVTRRQIGYNML